MLKLLIKFILCVCISTTYTYSQNQIVPLEHHLRTEIFNGHNDGQYYKDTNNKLNSFEGTWVFQDGNTSFKLVIEKKIQQHIPSANGAGFYQDYLIGEYQYIENGIDKINTLSNLQITFNHPYSYNLVGDILHTYDASEAGSCSGCKPSVLAVKCTFSEPGINDSYRTMMLWYINENGTEKLWGVVQGNESTNSDSNFKVPYGRYKYFIKQP